MCTAPYLRTILAGGRLRLSGVSWLSDPSPGRRCGGLSLLTAGSLRSILAGSGVHVLSIVTTLCVWRSKFVCCGIATRAVFGRFLMWLPGLSKTVW